MRSAHTLKGVSGNIGAMRVQEAAQALELACRDGKPTKEIDALLTTTLAELQPVIVSLEALRRPVEAGARHGELDFAAIGPLLQRLNSLLEDDDSDATDVVEALGSLLAGSFHAPRLRRVAAAIDEYAFGEALAALGVLSDALARTRSGG